MMATLLHPNIVGFLVSGSPPECFGSRCAIVEPLHACIALC
jgi:hypothetical protein